ncbi:hypothetical protein GA0116948_11361 [Chitinophaga costaii]|uniref:Terpene synthase n=1 Tax=Chitinophaga costaii TaxID=1335309 RepID=A0A1C4FC25_9BACT|nr:hypothetical protein [Chitinophaga costaii]PUZ20688.1 hypothetical protein DCM91_18160 [Chitinophaga costaii]SCC53597.1 hypothetical protein GA0116948_11361 [Chitinophaga costaii]
MNVLNFPKISYPFPSLINNFVHEANAHTTAWVQQFDLLSTPKAAARFERARFPWLAARAFPHADLFELCVIADFNTWLFMLDDQCDEADLGQQAEYLQSITAQLMTILYENKVATLENDGNLAASLSDIWQRMLRISRLEWRPRFIRSIEAYFESCLWEANNRAQHRTPTVEDYVKMRPYTGALFADVEAIEIIEKIYLPDAVLQHPVITRMVLACNNIVCWANDLFSCFKELQQGDVHNLVLVLKHEHHYGFMDAMQETARMHNMEVELFESLKKKLPVYEPTLQREVDRYIDVLQSWITANYDWSFHDTKRYAVEFSASLLEEV